MEVAEYIAKRKAEKSERDSALTASPGSQPKRLPSIVPTVTCRCGHTEHWERFNESGLGEELPPNHFRCPACHWQWTRVRVTEKYSDGTSGRTKIEIRDVEIPIL